MLLSAEEEKHASDLNLNDWMPSFDSKGLTRADVQALYGTFSQQMGQELRTYEQIYQHVCMVQIAMQKQPQANIDPVWVAQHDAFTPKIFVGEDPASASAADAMEAQDNAHAQQASALPRAQLHDIAEAARLSWKDAVEQRRKAVSDWDEYVRMKHADYDQAKANLKAFRKHAST